MEEEEVSPNLNLLHQHVQNVDKAKVRSFLDEHKLSSAYLSEILHLYLKLPELHTLPDAAHRRTVLYMLLSAGADVNYVSESADSEGNTALHLVMMHQHGDVELVEPLLQYGADMKAENAQQATPQQLTEQYKGGGVEQLIVKYQPGLWEAVKSDNLLDVRKLINLWCQVNIVKNDKTLLELTLEKGTEYIIRLVRDIQPSMCLAHYVLAEDVQGVKSVLADKKTCNLGLRNLGDMGATPLFYAIHHNHVELVKLLVEHGAHINAEITLQEEDIPLIFTALNSETDPEIIRTIVASRDSSTLHMSAVYYQGRSVLEQCVVSGVNIHAFKHILRMGYSDLLTLRNIHNECVRMVAERLNLQPYIDIIDEVVHDWYLDMCDYHRKSLALGGYAFMNYAQKDGVYARDVVRSMETSSPQALFDTQLQAYQDQILQACAAVEANNVDKLKSVLYFDTAESHEANCFHRCLANAQPLGDGMPLLHRAVLRSHIAVLTYLCETLNTECIALDSIRDQWHRTALHYAWGLQNGEQVVNVLLDYGASEFTMDQDSRSPLVFRDHQRHPNMKDLMRWHINPDYTEKEPDPWSRKMPPRNKGEILQHHKHAHQHVHPHTGPPTVTHSHTHVPHGGSSDRYKAANHHTAYYHNQQTSSADRSTQWWCVVL